MATRSGPRRDNGEALAELERALACVLQRLSHRATMEEIARRAGHDLPPTSWALLEHLDSRGTLRVSDIAACHGVDVSSVTPRLKALESEGLVVRETLPTDARVSLIRITPHGKQALDRVHAARRKLLARALADVASSRLATAARILDRIADALADTD